MLNPETQGSPESPLGARHHALRGAFTMGGAQVVRLVLQAAGIVVLARLLTPADYGLVAEVAAVIGIAEVLRDFGLTFASVQSQQMTREIRDNLFWLNTTAGLVLSVVAYLLAHPVAALYHEPRLVGITHAVAWVFFLNGVSAQARADLNRRLKFGALALGDMVAVFLGFVAAIVAAVLGAGYWALVVNQVVPALLAAIFYLLVVGWFPGRYHREVSTFDLVRYGASLVANQCLNYVSVNADSVIVGTRLGAVPLGAYDRAFQLLTLPMSKLSVPATKVALPILSRAQDDPPRFRALLVRGQVAVLHPVVALFGVMIGFGQLLIPLVLGGQWNASVVPFQVLCVGGMSGGAAFVTNWAFMATGRMRHYLRVTMVATPLTVVCMFVGSHWGIDGVAVGYTIGTTAYWPMSIWWLRGTELVPVRQLLGGGLRTVLWHLLPALVAAGIIRARHAHAVPSLVAIGVYVALSLVILAISGRLRAELRVLRGLALSRLGRRRQGPGLVADPVTEPVTVAAAAASSAEAGPAQQRSHRRRHAPAHRRRRR